MIISVTEGDDKPLKYPHMFSAADLIVINKTDLLPYVDFDVERLTRDARKLQPGVEVLAPVGADRRQPGPLVRVAESAVDPDKSGRCCRRFKAIDRRELLTFLGPKCGDDHRGCASEPIVGSCT